MGRGTQSHVDTIGSPCSEPMQATDQTSSPLSPSTDTGQHWPNTRVGVHLKQALPPAASGPLRAACMHRKGQWVLLEAHSGPEGSGPGSPSGHVSRRSWCLHSPWETGAGGHEGTQDRREGGSWGSLGCPGGTTGHPFLQRGMTGNQAGGVWRDRRVRLSHSDGCYVRSGRPRIHPRPPTLQPLYPQQPHQQPENHLMGNPKAPPSYECTAQTRPRTCRGRALLLTTTGQSQWEKQKRKPDKQFPYPTFSTFNYF